MTIPSHHHTWHLNQHSLLTLPDDAGYFEQAVSYLCPCGQYQVITGLWHHDTPTRSLEAWDLVAKAERRARGVLAQRAQQEERVRVR